MHRGQYRNLATSKLFSCIDLWKNMFKSMIRFANQLQSSTYFNFQYIHFGGNPDDFPSQWYNETRPINTGVKIVFRCNMQDLNYHLLWKCLASVNGKKYIIRKEQVNVLNLWDHAKNFRHNKNSHMICLITIFSSKHICWIVTPASYCGCLQSCFSSCSQYLNTHHILCL